MQIIPITPHEEENFFTPEEYASVYKTIYDCMDLGIRDAGDEWKYFKKLTNNGFIALFLSETKHKGLPHLSQEIEDKIRQKFEEKTGSTVDHIGMIWARYTPLSGDIPTLMPHQDRSETHVSYTFTLEMAKTLNWDFYVEDQKFEMDTNKAIWFSGTHQSHWRPDQKFEEDDYYDILLCQTHSGNDDNPLSEKHFDDGDEHSIDVSAKFKDLLIESMDKGSRINGACQ